MGTRKLMQQTPTIYFIRRLSLEYIILLFSPGGTLDVTVHMIEDDGTIKEIHKVTGGPYGGIYVNQRFENLLEEILGKQRLQNYQKQFPSDWLCLMNEFEGKKRGKRILDSGLMTNIRPPRSFVTLVNETGSSALKRYGETEIKLKNNEYLSLSSGMMKRLFSPVVEKIKQHLKTLVRKPELSKVRTMLLVGGFAEAAFLQQEMKLEFSKRGFRVLVPHHATTAVVQGAVMFCKSPMKITERVVATTYGSGCARDFIKDVHPEEKKITVHGVEKCNNLFKCFIKENESVQCGQKIKRSFSPLYPEEDKIEFSFYISSDPDVKFTTDPEVTRIGRVVVQSPDTWRGKDRSIEVSLCFGGTEITATALDISSGNKAQTTLDFFC